MSNDRKRFLIKDFYQALKDIEPLVKQPEFLKTGREFTNFNLRPREAWANWLLCVVLQEVNDESITFCEDPDGDGVILSKKTGQHIRTEHVSALNTPSPTAKLRNEERILNAINHKIEKGLKYAEGKVLVVFTEDAKKWYPNKVGRKIYGTHNFSDVFCVGLIDCKTDYRYSVTQFGAMHSPTWIVKVREDFTDWEVTKLQ